MLSGRSRAGNRTKENKDRAPRRRRRKKQGRDRAYKGGSEQVMKKRMICVGVADGMHLRQTERERDWTHKRLVN